MTIRKISPEEKHSESQTSEGQMGSSGALFN